MLISGLGLGLLSIRRSKGWLLLFSWVWIWTGILIAPTGHYPCTAQPQTEYRQSFTHGGNVPQKYMDAAWIPVGTSDMAQKNWITRNSDAILSGLLVCLVWAIVAFLAASASPLLLPLFFGFIAGVVTLVACVSVMVARRLPKHAPISEANIEARIREWLDNFKVTVKNDPGPDLHFRLRITLDSKIEMTILRSKTENSEYFQIVAGLGFTEENQKVWNLFTEEETAQILIDLKIELARAKIGYAELQLPLDKFHVFRRVPIVPGLTEFIFMSMLGDVEAAVGLVFQTFANARLRQLKQSISKAPTAEPATAKTLDRS
jgi:hypothetical protein